MWSRTASASCSNRRPGSLPASHCVPPASPCHQPCRLSRNAHCELRTYSATLPSQHGLSRAFSYLRKGAVEDGSRRFRGDRAGDWRLRSVRQVVRLFRLGPNRRGGADASGQQVVIQRRRRSKPKPASGKAKYGQTARFRRLGHSARAGPRIAHAHLKWRDDRGAVCERVAVETGEFARDSGATGIRCEGPRRGGRAKRIAEANPKAIIQTRQHKAQSVRSRPAECEQCWHRGQAGIANGAKGRNQYTRRIGAVVVNSPPGRCRTRPGSRHLTAEPGRDRPVRPEP